MKLLDWVAEVDGRAVDLDHAYGAQCVDLVNSWIEATGSSHHATGNAVDIIAQRIPGFTWVANGPANHPPRGAIVVWRANVPSLGIGAYGHCAVVIDADSMHLVTMDQNWTGRPRATATVHSYVGVAGWQQPAIPPG